MRSATASQAVSAESQSYKQRTGFTMASEEEALLKLDLSDLTVPVINDLQVDGLRSSWLSRLLGR
jgi:hypothetical protein